MPYPLASFSYSFQRRLRELASPIEAYHLQLADIDETVHLQPLQFETSLSNINLCLATNFVYLFPPVQLTKNTLLLPNEICIYGVIENYENAYDTLLIALSRFQIDMRNLRRICFEWCIIDGRLLRHFQSLNSTNQLCITLRSCTILEGVNINMVSGFNLDLYGCELKKFFFDGIVEFFNKTATTQNIKIVQSVYGITQLLDLNIVDVYGFVKSTNNLQKNNNLLLSRDAYGTIFHRTVLFQVLLKNSTPTEYSDCLRPRYHWRGKKWFTRIVNYWRFRPCSYYLRLRMTPPFLNKDVFLW